MSKNFRILLPATLLVGLITLVVVWSQPSEQRVAVATQTVEQVSTGDISLAEEYGLSEQSRYHSYWDYRCVPDICTPLCQNAGHGSRSARFSHCVYRSYNNRWQTYCRCY